MHRLSHEVQDLEAALKAVRARAHTSKQRELGFDQRFPEYDESDRKGEADGEGQMRSSTRDRGVLVEVCLPKYVTVSV